MAPIRDEERIALKEMIEQLRRELSAAAAGSQGEPLRFRVDSVELELQLEVERARGVKAEGKAEVKFWVWPVQAGLRAEAESSRAQTRTQTIRLRLTPQGPDGKKVLASRRG